MYSDGQSEFSCSLCTDTGMEFGSNCYDRAVCLRDSTVPVERMAIEM